jgi:hypothetical protein
MWRRVANAWGKYTRVQQWARRSKLWVANYQKCVGTMNERPEHVREIKLPKESEFRFELEARAPIAIRVRFPKLL